MPKMLDDMGKQLHPNGDSFYFDMMENLFDEIKRLTPLAEPHRSTVYIDGVPVTTKNSNYYLLQEKIRRYYELQMYDKYLLMVNPAVIEQRLKEIGWDLNHTKKYHMPPTRVATRVFARGGLV